YLMVSLSTRDLDARGKLSVVSNIPAVAGNGLMASIVMPMILSWVNSSPTVIDGVEVGRMVVQNRWQTVMTIFAVLAFLGCLLEYTFTRERITEEDIPEEDFAEKAEQIPTLTQLKAAVGDRFWWIIMIFYILYQAGVMFKGGYVFNIFCHTFFTEVHIFGQTLQADMVQSVLALISGVPLAAGMLFIWPLANKFGKRNMIISGCVVSILGSIVCLLAPQNFAVVLIGQTLKGFSSIPGAYIMMALFADVLDHLEAKHGYRVDGISMSVYSTILTVVNGLAVAFFNFFYDNAAFTQAGVTKFFFLGYEIIAHGALIVILLFLTVEKNIKEEQALIAERKQRN
ncbi:MAG: MFS transporter, partial [Blautia sp.]|nr:MFS transporter [Blautia sp.]